MPGRRLHCVRWRRRGRRYQPVPGRRLHCIRHLGRWRERRRNPGRYRPTRRGGRRGRRGDARLVLERRRPDRIGRLSGWMGGRRIRRRPPVLRRRGRGSARKNERVVRGCSGRYARGGRRLHVQHRRVVVPWRRARLGRLRRTDRRAFGLVERGARCRSALRQAILKERRVATRRDGNVELLGGADDRRGLVVMSDRTGRRDRGARQ